MNVLVTGGSRGIGFAIASECARAGHKLVLVAKDGRRLADAAKTIQTDFRNRVHTYSGDVADAQSLQSLVAFCAENGVEPDVLVLNAGIFLEGDIVDSPEELFAETMRVDFWSVVRAAKVFVPMLRKSKAARIVMIGSTAAYEAYPLGPLYGVAKWALRGLAVNLRKELAQEGIAVTFIAPGGTLTDLWAGEELPPDRLLKPSDIGILVEAMLRLSAQAVVEEIVVRPMLGDIHE